MRRILRKIAENAIDQIGDTSTLADPSVVDKLVEGADEAVQIATHITLPGYHQSQANIVATTLTFFLNILYSGPVLCSQRGTRLAGLEVVAP